MLEVRTNGHQALETTRMFFLASQSSGRSRENLRGLPRVNAMVEVLVETPNGKASWWKVMNQLKTCVLASRCWSSRLDVH